MYPMMIDLTGKNITIVGGGKVAYRKAMNFLSFGYSVQVIAPQFAAHWKQLGEAVGLVERTFCLEDLKESFVVVAATNDIEVNRQIGTYCKEYQILCNVVDNPALSSFTVPAVVKRGELVISISTGGASPTLAKKIKSELEEKYPTTYEEYLMHLGRLRKAALDANLSAEEKSKWLQEIVEMDLETLRSLEKSSI